MRDDASRHVRSIEGGEAGVLDTPEDTAGIPDVPRHYSFPVDKHGDPLCPYHREALRILTIGLRRVFADRRAQEAAEK